MGMMKNYLLKLLAQCSVEQFGQAAIEWAITTGMVHLSYDLHQDVRTIMLQYDEIIDAYRPALARAKAPTAMTPAPMKRAGERRVAKPERSDTSERRENAA